VTEEEWLAWVGDPVDLYSIARDCISDRKLRLFACACVRQVWGLLDDERGRHAVVTGELLADGQVSDAVAMTAAAAAGAAAFEASTTHGVFSMAEHLAVAAKYAVVRSALLALGAANRAASARDEEKVTLQRTQSVLFREIVGNPFRPVTIDLAWLTPTVVSLAQAAYDERILPSGELDVARLAVLADALEEAGCADAAILSHLRSPGPHVRGCWALDLILGKE
jgi:hypothetical protein